MNCTLVLLGNLASVSMSGPSSCASRAETWSHRITQWGLPMVAALYRSVRPPASMVSSRTSRSGPRTGILRLSKLMTPISTVTERPSCWTCALTTPPGVEMVNGSAPTKPSSQR